MITSIDFKLVGNDEKRVSVKLDGKNLIITGANGCGKTRFLKHLHSYLGRLVRRQIQTDEELTGTLRNTKVALSRLRSSDRNFLHYSNEVVRLSKLLESLNNEQLVIDNIGSMYELINSNHFVLRLFEASRNSSKIVSNGNIESISSVKKLSDTQNVEQDLSQQFEKYLVSYYNYGSHVIAREKDIEKEQKISDWFDKVQEDFRNLFEDPKLVLKYNPEEQVFYIFQGGKEPYRFKDLSSGYSSILCIYADLLMKVELREVPANELTGIVLIDEIDAHLHVSIQRKIFSFFDKAFPKIQFIVTTHSPFVIQSVNNSIIYDLSKLTPEPLENLSMYSYESILKGLLGVDSTSDILNKQLDEIASLINQNPLNQERLKELIESIEPHKAQLDSRSRAFLLLGRNALLDTNDGGE